MDEPVVWRGFIFNRTAPRLYLTLSERSADHQACVPIRCARPRGCRQIAGSSCRSSCIRSASPALATSCRPEEHPSELQSLIRLSYAVFCLKTNNLDTTSL